MLIASSPTEASPPPAFRQLHRATAHLRLLHTIDTHHRQVEYTSDGDKLQLYMGSGQCNRS